MKAEIKWVEGLKFVATSPSGHSIVMDVSRDKNASAPSPMEFLLIAIGGCTAVDVVSILRKMKEPLEDLKVYLKGKRRDSPPKFLTEVKIVYEVYGKNIDRKKVERAVKLSQEKYCSVSHNIKPKTKVDYLIKIKGEKG